MESKTFAVLTALFIFFLIVEMIRRQRMTFKYSFFWLSASAATVCLAVFDGVVKKISSLAGFELPSNFIFFIFIAGVSALGLFLSVYINEQSDRTEKLAQSLGLLENQLRNLRQELEAGKGRQKLS